MTSTVRAGQTRVAEVAPAYQGRVVPARVYVVSVDGEWAVCRRLEAGMPKPRRWRCTKLEKAFPLVEGESPG